MLAETFLDCFREYDSRTAVADPELTLTYGEVSDNADDVVSALRRYARADVPVHVGLQAANSAAYIVCYVAILRAGFVPFLIDAALGPNEVARIADECSLDLLIHDDRDLGGLGIGPLETVAGLTLTAAHPSLDRSVLRSDTEVCRFSSGSTGKSNCIEFSGRAVVAAATNWSRGTGLTAGDRIACLAALSNGLAFNTSLLPAFMAGASLHLSRGLPTGGHVSRLLQRAEATWLVGFPALYESAVRRRPDRKVFEDVHIAISSAAPLREETRLAFTELTGVPISNYYGVAETGPLTFATGTGGDGGHGRPLPGVRLTAGSGVADPSEIRALSESMGSRYLNAPGLFEARIDVDGYYGTGDDGYLNDRGLFLTGRSDRMINVGGRKVDPLQVVEVVRRAPGVRDAAVFEATDRHGEPTVAAAVTGDPNITANALRDHCGAELADYKVPRTILVVPEIPSNSTGKPSIEALRRLVGQPSMTPRPLREDTDERTATL